MANGLEGINFDATAEEGQIPGTPAGVGVSPSFPGQVVFPPRPPRTTTTSVIASEQDKALAKRREKLRGETEALAGELTKTKVAEAKSNKEAADFQLAEAGKEKEIAERAEREAADKFNAFNTALQSDIEKNARAEYPGYWANKSAGQKALAVISVALAGIGDIFSAKAGRDTKGVENVLDRINSAMDQDWQTFRERIERENKGLAARGATATQLAERMERKEGARKIAGSKVVEAKVKAMLAATGMKTAEINSHWLVNELQNQRLKDEESVAAGFRTRVTTEKDTAVASTVATGAGQGADVTRAAMSAVPPKLSESQSRAVGLGLQIVLDNAAVEAGVKLSQSSLVKLRELEALERFFNANPGKRFLAVRSGQLKTPEQILKPNEVATYQAYRRLAQNVLFSVSGAAVPEHEKIAWVITHSPAIGDTAASDRDKRRARLGWVNGAVEKAGPGKPMILSAAKTILKINTKAITDATPVIIPPTPIAPPAFTPQTGGEEITDENEFKPE